MSVPVIIRLARKFNCLDYPGKRRFHRAVTPRWGGIAFFLSVIPAVLLTLNLDRTTLSYTISSLILVVTGMVDDRRQLGWKFKMSAIAVATALVVFGGGVVVRQIGTISLGTISLGWFSVPFTFIGVIGVTNAMNMIDGLNGLSAGVSCIAFLFLGIAALQAGNLPMAILCFAFVGTMIGFLRYNFPRASIFMGDSGSMFLGFSLAVVSIQLTQQGSHAIAPLFPLLVLLVPIFDAVRLMAVRLLHRGNPFVADKIHMHHLILRNGLSSVRTVLLMWSLVLACGIAALAAVDGGSVSLLVAVGAMIAVLAVFVHLLVLRKKAKQYRMRARDLSSAGRPQTAASPRSRVRDREIPVLVKYAALFMSKLVQ